MYRILLVEDDKQLATVLKDFFEDNHLNVLWAGDGEEAISLYENEHPHLILLDIILPGKDGFEVITEIREKDYFIPIVLMTGTEFKTESVVKGYRSGAVNYLKKPVPPEEVLALIESLLHRSYGVESYAIGDYHITIQSQMVKINGNPVQLREKDIQVFSLLLKNPGLLVTRQHILQTVWQDDGYERNNSLDTSISRIRKRLRPYPAISLERVYGEGYALHFALQTSGKTPNP